MCEPDDLGEFSRRRELTRRQFGAMALGAGLVAMLPKSARAAQTSGQEVQIRTPDGVAVAYMRNPAHLKGPPLVGDPRGGASLQPAFIRISVTCARWIEPNGMASSLKLYLGW